MANASSTAIAPYRATLEKALPSIKAVLPATIAAYLTPERMVKIVLVAMNRNPELMTCTQTSLLRCVMDAAELGIEPSGGAMGHAYLVPYRRKDGSKDAQLIIGYRGYISLARRSGTILSVESHVVHERDSFVLRYGTDPILSHTPALDGDPGQAIGAYSVANFKDGGRHVEFMTLAEINAIRKRSKASSSGPWVTDYEEMCRKTVIRRAAKYWPISTEMARAMEVEDRIDTSIDDLSIDLGTDAPQLPESSGSAVEDLKRKLAPSEQAVEETEVPATEGE